MYNYVEETLFLGGISMKNKTVKISLLMFIILLLVCLFSILSFGADSFENQIAAFPESYKPQLRELHKKYPDWKFECVNTGLDWYDAVKNESDFERSAVPKAASALCKSHAPGYYFPDTGTYKETDAGWNDASPDTVAYFLDPRNFLTETGIFQFELLSFTTEIKVSDVEQILKGTFMYDTNITYYNTSGVLKKTTIKYSQCIYDAGKANNINPCFLASKIRNEIVTGGGYPSGSVTGQYKGYEGYYNFFNIGAYAGTTPIANGLKYAKTPGSYGRPWDTPMKSINGGAQFLAQSYIGKGQNTGYFQKFNVSPYAVSKPYTHQYMSNVSGADSQGYSTYLSYSADGLLSLSRTFAIPVYDNMPGAEEQVKDFTLFDTNGQTAKPTTTVNVRTEPNTSGSVVVSVKPDTAVTVLSKCRNSSWKYAQQLYYPYWYYIAFTQDGKKYTGYAVADYFSLNTALNVKKGVTFDLPANAVGSEKPTLYTWDTSVVSIGSDFSVKALKNGTAYITATTSAGGYDYIKINVGSYSDSNLTVSGFSSKPSSTGATLSWNKVSSASGYEITLSYGDKVLYSKNLPASTLSVNVPLSDSKVTYSAKIRAYKSDSSSKYNGEYSVIDNFSVLPQKVYGLKFSDASLSSFTLSWNAVAGADGYQIRKLNKETNLYEPVVSTSKTAYTFTKLKEGTYDTYKVRAYVVADGKRVYGTTSSAVDCYTYKYSMDTPTDFTVKTSYVTVKFDPIPEAEKYYAYMLDSSTGKYVKCGETDKPLYQFTSLSEGNEYNVMIEAVSTPNSKEIILSSLKFIIKTLPGQVRGLKQTSSDSENVSVSWTAVSGANAYRIYVYDTAKKAYSFIKEVKTNSYTFTGLSPLSDKNIKVLATVKNYGKKSYGKASDPLYVYTGPAKVKSLSFSEVKADSVSLKWKALSGSDGYMVYSVNTDTGKEKLLKTVGTNSCTVSSLKDATEYSFIVRGYRAVNSKKITGSASSVLNVKTAPDIVEEISVSGNTTTGYTLSWKALDGANGYSVYRYNTKTKKYELLAQTAKTKLTVKNLTAAKRNSYKISAYVTVGDDKYHGELSEKYVAATLPKAPESVTVKKLSNGALKVSWKKASGVSGARVYIYNSRKAQWSSVGITTSDNFTISADKINSSITKVRVKAYIKVNGIRYYSSAKSAPVTK